MARASCPALPPRLRSPREATEPPPRRGRSCPASQQRGRWWMERLHLRRLDFDGDASLQQVDGDDEQAFLRLGRDQDALEPLQRAIGDADALAFGEKRMREDRYVGVRHAPDRLDLVVRDAGGTVPVCAQYARDTARLQHLDVA